MRATMEVVVWKLIWNVIERGNYDAEDIAN